MSSPPSGGMPQGPPYLPQTAGLGGRPTTSVDDPISGVILGFFVAGAILNMTIFQLNRKRSHKFVLSGLLFGFCMARISANVLRIVWASYPNDVSIAIAAQVFANAGVVLLFVVNLIFAQRILRAYHLHIGWSKPASLAFKFLYFSILASLVMLITAVVTNFYTLNKHTKQQLRDLQLTGSTFLAILAFLPLPIVGLCFILPRKAPMDKFGQGRMRTKIYLLVFTTVLLSLGAWFRTGVSYKVVPVQHPRWYHSKACFYCFNYVIEIIVVFSYALSRFDRRFHVPDGSHAPGDYSGSNKKTQERMHRVNTEEEVFGDDERPRTADQRQQQQNQWEAGLKKELNEETV
ncbi:hypothetical protein F53441_6842 [Fusarium austroafricanum]|uniref:Uncharacterized protein n=1 Tax=Fusarium austroafricanum TaxID=2364996 RepID=A0A8H4KIM5_9HYPO|nr:hypothetical protein F53441_6842 [Fusarium austroafricanum]